MVPVVLGWAIVLQRERAVLQLPAKGAATRKSALD
jgi:hypothetical protein